jgi:hypothetical protein
MHRIQSDEPFEQRCATLLVRGLIADFGDRDDGLDDYRRYHQLLRLALRGLTADSALAHVHDRVAVILAAEPHRRGHELLTCLEALLLQQPQATLAQLTEKAVPC